jgi:tetratricopeptide (TPR) repeat protein
VLAELAFRQEDYAQAQAYYEESLSIYQEGRHWESAHLAYVLLRQGALARAREVFAESQLRFQALGSKTGVVYALEGMASLAVAEGRWSKAAQLFGWADATRVTLDDRRPLVEQADVDRDLATVQAHLDDASFAQAWAAGQALTMEQAVACALD